MFDRKLWHIKNELNSRGSNNQLSLHYVMKRLNKSLESYMHDLKQQANYLLQYEPQTIVKKL